MMMFSLKKKRSRICEIKLQQKKELKIGGNELIFLITVYIFICFFFFSSLSPKVRRLIRTKPKTKICMCVRVPVRVCCNGIMIMINTYFKFNQ